LADFEQIRLSLRGVRRHVTVLGVDKFPRMLDYVVPDGVRVADGDRVRLGAYLAAGTTVMHEGFVNFNAGTLGQSMVEGRISQGVVVGAGTDIGGGASIMGTLSGGGKEMVTIGEAACSAPNPGLASRSGTTASSRQACTSPPVEVRLPDGRWSRRASCPASATCSTCETRSRGRSWRALRRAQAIELNDALHTNS